MELKALFNGDALSVRHDLVCELLPDEPLELRPASAIEQVSGPATAVVDGSALRCTVPGRYVFRVDGARDLRVLCFESECLARVDANARGTGHGLVEARSVIRSLATHAEWFAGRAESLVNRSLAAYGN